MKQMSQVRSLATAPAVVRGGEPAEPVTAINDGDLDKVSGGGGKAGGVVGSRGRD
jgi:hypothetical protein